MNVIVVVSKRALVVIHNLSDSHLQSGQQVIQCLDGHQAHGAKSFASKIVRQCQDHAHPEFIRNRE